MARPRTDHQLPETRDRLLDAALIQFAAGGFAGTRLDDIAEDAGLRRSSLLYHFPTKDHLYTAVVRRAFSALAAELEAAMAAPGSFPEQVANLERRYLDFVTARPEFATLILREILDGHGPGRGLLLDQVVPLLDGLDAFLDAQGADKLRADVPRREALLQVATAALVRAAAGPLREPLWGPAPSPPGLAARLLLQEGS